MSFFRRCPSFEDFNALAARVAELEAKPAAPKQYIGRIYFGLPNCAVASWNLPPEATVTEPPVRIGDQDGFYFLPMWRTGYDPSVDAQLGILLAFARPGGSWVGGGGDPKELPQRFAYVWQGWHDGKAGLFLAVRNADGTLGADYRYDIDILAFGG